MQQRNNAQVVMRRLRLKQRCKLSYTRRTSIKDDLLGRYPYDTEVTKGEDRMVSEGTIEAL